MNRYTVIWDPDVEARFIGAWVAGDPQTRAILTEVADWIDASLAVDPGTKGLARDDLGVRILAVPCTRSTARVSATYQILPEDRQVRVVRLTFRGG